MTPTRIHLLNAALICASLLAALAWPFELFLGAYAVLGPLHYLTELAWLNKRGFYLSGRRQSAVLALLCGLYVLVYLVRDAAHTPWAEPFYVSVWGPSFGAQMDVLGGISAHFIYGAFALALVFVAFNSAKAQAFASSAVLLLAAVAHGVPAYVTLFTSLLPTLVHVFGFTAAFMLFGAIKERSGGGLLTLGLMLTAGVLALTLPGAPKLIGRGVFAAYVNAGFQDLNLTILSSWLGPLDTRSQRIEALFASWEGLALQRFVAFAYTYHYLNWFSKTTVIKWHKVSRRAWVTVTLMWVLSLALYAWDYQVGVMVLLGLSLLHVFMEFPLNHRCLMGIVGAVTSQKHAGS